VADSRDHANVPQGEMRWAAAMLPVSLQFMATSRTHSDLTGIAAFRSCRTLRKMCEFVERPKDPYET